MKNANSVFTLWALFTGGINTVFEKMNSWANHIFFPQYSSPGEHLISSNSEFLSWPSLLSRNYSS